jgi:hypothetical protein
MRFGQMRAGVLAGLIGFAAACGDSNVLGPDNQLEVANLTDNFQLQATAIVDVSETLSYVWQNTGTSANVNQSGTVTGGSATLTIQDGAGTEVYQGNLTDTGTFQTSTGVAGDWIITVVLNGLSGSLNFRVQKP